MSFDQKSQKALLLVRENMIAQPKTVTAEGILKFTYDMPLFLAVSETSFSFK